MKRLALIGSKEFALQIKEFAESEYDFTVVGFFDDFATKGDMVEGSPILGKISDIESEYAAGRFDCVFLAAGYNNFQFRENTYNCLRGKVPFANIIRKSAIIHKGVSIGEGVFIGGKSVIGANSIIGNNVFIHGGSDIGHDNHIGSHTYISGRFNSAGFTSIGERCFFGICTIVSDHIKICNDVWVGIGSIVIKDIKEPGKYMSNIKLLKIE